MKHFFNFIFLIISVVVISSCGQRNKPAVDSGPSPLPQPDATSFKRAYVPFSIYSDDSKKTLNFDVYIFDSNNIMESRNSLYLDFENQILRFEYSDPNYLIPFVTTRKLKCVDSIPTKCMSYEFECPRILFTEIVTLKIGKMEIEQVETGIKTIKNIYKIKFPTPMTVSTYGMTYSEKEILFIPSEARDTLSSAESLMINENNVFYDNNNELLNFSNKFQLPGQLISASPNSPMTRELDSSQGKITDTYINSKTGEEEKRSWILKFIF